MSEERKKLTREDIRNLIHENGDTSEGLDLSSSRFVDAVDLSGLDLSGIILKNAHLFRANFNGSILARANMQNAYLGYAAFNPLNSETASLQGVDLRGANLHDAEFRNADLTGAQFQETKFQATTPTPEIQDKLLEILPARLERTDFRKANLFRADFTGCYFYSTKLEGAFIRGADITTNTHLGQVDWGDFIIGEEAKPEELHFAEYRYRYLKMWYTNAGYYDIAAKFYYREKETRRKALKLLSKSWNHRLALEFMRVLFGYGEHWERIVVCSVGIIFGLAIVYRFSGVTIEYALYYSAVSFSALGYGSWVQTPASDWVQTVGAIESLLGVLMMALLLVTFVRKWTR